MIAEFHISSFIIQTQPGALQRLLNQVALLPGVEIHNSCPAGKIIITLECDSTDAISTTTNAINDLTGVLSCNMVFHQIEQESTHEHTSQ